ncbi:MAG: hypothetical protein GX591_06100 [Planctomycetes bacterium]|nr:hypothetical protein [Planctomycetota bacterium]
MTAWLETHHVWLTVLAVASVLAFIGSLVAVPMIVARIPADYFAHRRRPGRPLGRRCAGGSPLVCRIFKNLLGAILLLGGLAMMVLPGQGLLTLFIGLLLLDVPGKYRVEKWIVSRRPVRRAVNWLRRRAKREPLRIEGVAPGR